MNSPRGQLPIIVCLLACCWLAAPTSVLHAQMQATVSSLADDSDAYPWELHSLMQVISG